MWTVTATDRKAHEVAVTLGARLGNRVIITSGLKTGDAVAVKGVHRLTEGQILGARIEG